MKGQSNTNLTGFKGGDFELISFLFKNTRYPIFTTDSVHTEVTVIFEFVVDRKGEIIEKSLINRIPETELFEKSIHDALMKTNNMWVKGKRKRKIIIPFVFQILTPIKSATVESKYPFPFYEYLDSLKSAGKIAREGLLLPAVYIRVFRGRTVE